MACFRSFFGKANNYFSLFDSCKRFASLNYYRTVKLSSCIFRRQLIWCNGSKFIQPKINNRLFIYGGILTFLGLKKEEEEEDPLINTVRHGVFALQKGDYNTAEQILHAALKIAQEVDNQQAVTYIYDILANVAFQKEDFQKAEILFVNVMNRMISTGTSEKDNAIIEMSLKLAMMFDQQKLFSKAEDGYQFCLKAQQEKMDSINLADPSSFTELEQDTVLLWAMSTDWYGRHLMAMGKLQEAQENILKAYKISETVNGPLHPQTLVLINDLGSIASLRENYIEALDFLNKAIEKGKLGESPDLAAFYCNLGATYMKTGDHLKALKSCKEALSLAKAAKHKEAEDDAQECLRELKKIGVK